MDNFEYTKIAGAVLSALLLIFGTKTMIEMRSHGETKPGYTLPVADASGASEGDAATSADAAAAAPAEDFTAVLKTANADEGKAAFSKCKGCHIQEKGKASTVGPNLYGVVDRKIGAYDGFKYTEALAGKGGAWSFDELNKFLTNPKAYAPGTKMVFAGIKDAKTRADLIAYLASVADTPAELPK